LSLNDRVEALARELAQRENKHVEAIERAHYKAAELHRQVAAVIDRFNVVVGESVP
jgi:phage shock protein A